MISKIILSISVLISFLFLVHILPKPSLVEAQLFPSENPNGSNLDKDTYTDLQNSIKKTETTTAKIETTLPKETLSEEIEISGPVTKVVDGDTIDVNDIRIRLSLVDTPERGQPGFQEATDFVKELCQGKDAQVDIDDGQRGGDRYGRELGVVYCGDDNININNELIKNSLAIIDTRFCENSEFANENWAKQCQE